MAEPYYRSTVKVGNWYENKFAEEIFRKRYKLQQTAEEATRNALNEFLVEEQLSVCVDQIVHFGDKVLIQSPEPLLNKGSPKERRQCVALCVAPPIAAIERRLSLLNVPIVGSTEHLKPCKRNVFQILPVSQKNNLKEPLYQGDNFLLKYISSHGESLYMASPCGTALCSSRGSRRQEVLLERNPDVYSSWKVLPADPLKRLKPDTYVQAGTLIRIQQVMSNQPLVVEEEFQTKCVFGEEADISVGVVNRATTRACPLFTFFTWSQSQAEPTSYVS